MDYRCTIEVEPKNPEAVASALRMEEAYDRSFTVIENTEGKVFIKISAKDITALRAAVNDYLRLLRICEVEKKILK